MTFRSLSRVIPAARRTNYKAAILELCKKNVQSWRSTCIVNGLMVAAYLSNEQILHIRF